MIATTLVAALLLSGGAAEERSRLPRFEVEPLKGKRLRNRDLEGKVAVVSFWATWCTPCKRELDFLSELRGEHKDLMVIAVATDGPETQSSVRGVVRRKRWSFTSAIDSDGSVSAALNPKGSVPFTLFVDKKGRVAHIHAGFKSGDEALYRELATSLMAESDS